MFSHEVLRDKLEPPIEGLPVKRGNLSLPNKRAVGTFSYVDQIIRLGGYSSQDIYVISPGDDLRTRVQRVLDLYRTAYHEYTHFLDLTTTVYGLTLVNKLVMAVAYFAKKGAQADPRKRGLKALLTPAG